MPEVVTIGVYGFSEQEFLAALRSTRVRLLLDVRQRRGVRGSRYPWANSNRLQAALGEAGISYEHRKELAPTTEMRRLQYAEDARRGVGQRTRVEIGPEFRRRYEEGVLGTVDPAALAEDLPRDGATALMCVEADPGACHRSLIAEHLARRRDVSVRHILPPVSR
jgi:uncharacterized protein (DUF488 family)